MEQKKRSEPYLSAYLHRKGRALGLPIAGSFELTARCNFNCPMCYVHLTEAQVRAEGKELTAEQWLQIAAAAREKGMVFALLTGGEPLMRRDFFEIYDGMKKMGLLISVNSNGSMLCGEVLERFLQDPPVRFNISLYGACSETYASMCGLPVFDRVKENIRALRQAGIDVSVNLSITPQNVGDLDQIRAVTEELGVPVRASSYMYPPVRVNGGQPGTGCRLSPAEAAAAAVRWDTLRFTPEEFARRAERIHRLEGLVPEGCPAEEESGIRCRAGSSSFWMTWDGRMRPCGMMTSPTAYPLETGFDAAWEQIKAAARQIRLPAACTDCAMKELCGVCAAVCQTETGRFDAVPAYVCRRAGEQVRQTWECYQERIKP